ncbi:GMC oxidoreductase [Auriscalpium vulgare]|uniref:GMC oxidoreductase n=1 Tax=Auriscalpium vulgare TaxID=40419 RepID=A0ACB8RQU4_9AGAM|nr:GMC oxidoreductase [Auriscalpium vulgare]
MFQVASRPAHQPAYDMQYQHPHHPSALPNLQLPRNLQRPSYAEVSREAITSVEPGLAQVPFEYIRKGLHARGEELMASVSAAHVPQSLPKSRLPSAVDLPPAHAQPPTHILAVFSSPTAKHPGSDTAVLIPTHHIVLAANCVQLPRFPDARVRQRSNGMMSVPVIPLTVPAAEAFAPLHAFLVSHRLDRFIGALLPVPPAMLSAARAGSSSGPLAHLSAPQLATYLAGSAGGDKMSALMGLTRSVSAVWRNACALGVYDRDLWACLDFSWEVILGKEINPGPDVQTDEQLTAWLKKNMNTIYHTVGSCAMLPRAKGGVVDPQLKVYGTANVRVVDLSIVPLHITSHTQGTAYAIAEQAADIIKGVFAASLDRVVGDSIIFEDSIKY